MTDASPLNIAAYLPRVAAQQPDNVAIHCPIGRDASGAIQYVGKTYGELNQASDDIARGLKAYGIGQGVRTALMVKPSFEFFALTFALMKTGAVMVMLDPGIGLKNIKTCLGEAEPEAFIGIPTAQAARVILGWARGSVKRVVTVGPRLFWGGTTLSRLQKDGADDAPFEIAPTGSDDLAAILFTSGSTGVPKGVMHRHANMAAQVESIRKTYNIQPGEVDLATFPPFALFDPALGMTTVVPDMDPTRPADVDPRNIISAVEKFQVTNMFGSPALLNTVGRYGAREGVKLPTLKRVISAGAPVPPLVMERFLTMLQDDAQVVTPYGATESLPVSSISSREVLGDIRARTEAGAGVCVGHPVELAEVKIIAITDEPLPRWEDVEEIPQGQKGEVVVRGPMVTRGYYNREGSNQLAKITMPDGSIAHRMGDIGYFDDDGRLWFCGRKAHRVNTEAGTLFSVPCELVFNTHPQVYRSALVGVPNGQGKKPVMCVQLENNTPESPTLKDELRTLAQSQKHTKGIDTFLVHPSFPVDIRHNAKIRREDLAGWAASRVQ